MNEQSVGAVYDRPFSVDFGEKRAVIDRPYSRPYNKEI